MTSFFTLYFLVFWSIFERCFGILGTCNLIRFSCSGFILFYILCWKLNKLICFMIKIRWSLRVKRNYFKNFQMNLYILEKCIVCRKFLETDLVLLACGHAFHHECLLNKNICPRDLKSTGKPLQLKLEFHLILTP